MYIIFFGLLRNTVIIFFLWRKHRKRRGSQQFCITTASRDVTSHHMNFPAYGGIVINFTLVKILLCFRLLAVGKYLQKHVGKLCMLITISLIISSEYIHIITRGR